MGITETAPSAVRQLKVAGMITTLPDWLNHTGEDATSSRTPFCLDYWVGMYPKSIINILWPEPNCRILMQKYSILRILK